MANVESCNYINIIFMREQNPPPPMTNMLNRLTTRHPLWPMLNLVITSTLSSWGNKIRHPLWTLRWLRDINSGQTSRLQRTCLTSFFCQDLGTRNPWIWAARWPRWSKRWRWRRRPRKMPSCSCGRLRRCLFFWDKNWKIFWGIGSSRSWWFS